MSTRTCFALILSAASTITAWADTRVDMNVVVDMTPEGRTVQRPSPAHPAYYQPVVGGYTELGGVFATERPELDSKTVVRYVAATLSKEGYLKSDPAPYINTAGEITYADGTVVTVPSDPSDQEPLALNQPGNRPLTLAIINAPGSPYSSRPSPANGLPQPSHLSAVLRTVDPIHGPVLMGMPSLYLVIHWGNANGSGTSVAGKGPDSTFRVRFGDTYLPLIDPTERYTKSMMMSLVAGESLDNYAWIGDFARTQTESAASSDRYFITLSAVDYDAYRKTHKLVILWQAKISVPSNGLAFPNVVQPLLTVAGPLFGRETIVPAKASLSFTPSGRVIIGPTRIVVDSKPYPVAMNLEPGQSAP